MVARPEFAADHVTGLGKRPAPQVSVLVVAYNSVDCIDRCLGSIASACARHTFEVLFIDNGDGSTEALVRARYPWVVIVASRGNVGFAAANNLLSAEASAPYLLLANPDAELMEGAIDVLLDAALGGDGAAAWGGVTLDRDGTPSVGNLVGLPSLREMASRVIGRSSAGEISADALAVDAEVDALSGSFVMIDRGAWDSVGGLDDSYFLYSEEIDLFYRLGAQGRRFRRIAAARAYHDVGHGEPVSSWRMLYLTAGKMQFARLHWSKGRQVLAFLFLWWGAVVRVAAGRVLGPFKPRLRTIGEGHRDIAAHPAAWRHGYDPRKGLLPWLKRREARGRSLGS